MKIAFSGLLESVKQGAAIMKGKAEPSRSFEFPETEIRALREHMAFRRQVCAPGRYQRGNITQLEQGRRKPEGRPGFCLRWLLVIRSPADIAEEPTSKAKRKSFSTSTSKKRAAR